MKRKVYLLIMSVSLICIILELYFILIRPNINAQDEDMPESGITNGYLSKMNSKVDDVHCTDNICVDVISVGNGPSFVEVSVKISNNKGSYIKSGGFRIISVNDKNVSVEFHYDSLKVNDEITKLSISKSMDLLKMEDYYIEEVN